MHMLRTTALLLVTCASLAIAPFQDSGVQKEVTRLGAAEKLVPKDKQALFMLRAEGVQIYGTEEKAGQLSWKFQEPRATLFEYANGAEAGTHAKGPVWSAKDGGKLTGSNAVKEPAPNANAVEWLLLEAKSEGGGRFAKVTHIQRLDTWGGKPPADAPKKAGETAEVRYEATYVFLGDK
jgi:hypothetical protein